MKEIKFKDKSNSYSVVIGNNTINILPSRIKSLCPKTKKIAIIIDNKVPHKFKKILKTKLRNYKLFFYSFAANEKTKSISSVNKFLNKFLNNNLSRSDLILGVGGGITGDVVGFTASIFKRGINYISLPTTLLAQVDSAIGGKTGVNSIQGKNLIGSFYQPKLVVSDINFLKSLPKKEMVCGYAEILKHGIIKDKVFFRWLEKNSENLLCKKPKELIHAITKSCKIKLFVVNRDVNEKGLRMILNFGHTFAHALEVKNNYSKSVTHGEAVLSGIILETRLSVIKNICNLKVLKQIEKIYVKNKLQYTYKNFSNSKLINNLLPFLKHDKKNDDEKINFILLRKIGKTTKPNAFKISLENLKKYCKPISQY